MGSHDRTCFHRVPSLPVDGAGCEAPHRHGTSYSKLRPGGSHGHHRPFCLLAGFRMFLAANSLALCYYLGPSRSASLALKCALVCAAGKFAQIVITSSPSKVGLQAASVLRSRLIRSPQDSLRCMRAERHSLWQNRSGDVGVLHAVRGGRQ